MRVHHLLLLAAVVIPTAQAQSPAPADSERYRFGRFSIVEENDYFADGGDKHYTQGARLSYLTPELTGRDPLAPLGLPIFAAAGTRRLEIMLGQSIFTPRNLTLANPDPRDRPYGGWLYAGVSLLQETNGRMLENLELEAGMVGRHAFGKEVQNDWHQFIQVRDAQGWRFQLRDEPGVLLSYERKWRMPAGRIGDLLEFDLIPEMGATLGNVYTYGEAGALVRMGKGLKVDYGPVHVRPSPSGTGWFDGQAARELDSPGWYVYLGAQGRAVGRNVFLDGNTFRDSRNVDKLPFVGDLTGGFSLFWSDAVKLDFFVLQRSAEFHGQGGQDRFGGLSVSFRFW